MENYKSELTSLKEELTSRIDAVIAKIEKPKFEVGKWYNNESNTFLFCYQGETSYGFGNADNYEIDLETASLSPRFYHLATPKEVEEALTKEAVKRGFKDGVRFKSAVEPNDKDNFIFKSPFDFKINYNNNGTRLWGASSGCIFSNGKWATPIKTKTIEELAIEFDNFAKNSSNIHIYFKEYLTENKQEIIETLNNL